MDENKEKIKPLKYVHIDSAYDTEYISYPSVAELTLKINEIIAYINKEEK